MSRAVLTAGILFLSGAMPLGAQQTTCPPPASPVYPWGQPAPDGGAALPEALPQPALPLSVAPSATALPEAAVPGPTSDAGVPADAAAAAPCAPADPWQTVWGVIGLRLIAAGPRIAPNGYEYHPLFSLDLNFNLWLWRSQRLYLFSDTSFWGEKAEYGVTNGKDGGLGFSKREFDLTLGPAWNYYGNWEARLFGYSLNNLNRGQDEVDPVGFDDGFGVENRYYLSPEYAKLGQTGFDVARATFLSVGYYLSKQMVDNDGIPFTPGLLLRAYLIYDLWDWPAYAFCDAQFISTDQFQPKMLYYDLGLAARPFARGRQWEFRLGVDNSADFQVHSVLNLWYGSIRYIF